MFTSQSKIIVVGTSGAGKSTLARKLSKKYSLADIELDALFWGPNWTGASDNVFAEKIQTAISESNGWVIHGNHGKVRPFFWDKLSAPESSHLRVFRLRSQQEAENLFDGLDKKYNYFN